LFRDILENGQHIYERNVVDDDLNKKMMDLLLEMDPARDGQLFDQTLRKFSMIENEHLTEEEQFLEQIRPMMSAEALTKLYHNIVGSLAGAPTHPHPSGPSHEIGAKIMHPIVGMVDHMVDSMTGRDKENKPTGLQEEAIQNQQMAQHLRQ